MLRDVPLKLWPPAIDRLGDLAELGERIFLDGAALRDTHDPTLRSY